MSSTPAWTQRISGASPCGSYARPLSHRISGSSACDVIPATRCALSLSHRAAASQRAPPRRYTDLDTNGALCKAWRVWTPPSGPPPLFSLWALKQSQGTYGMLAFVFDPLKNRSPAPQKRKLTVVPQAIARYLRYGGFCFPPLKKLSPVNKKETHRRPSRNRT